MNDSVMKMAPPVAAALVLMGLCAAVQGKWSERWQKVDSEQIRRWTDHLKRIPTKFGAWEGVEGEGSTAEEKSVAKFEGERPIAFSNAETEKRVFMQITCGYGRYVSVHTPQKCYPAAGYALGEQPRTYTIELPGGRKAEFYTAFFLKEGSEGVERVRILWAWNDGSGWDAPGWPKVAYARAPALYKMYLIANMPRHDSKIEDLGIVEFVKEFFPHLDKALADDDMQVADISGAATPAAAPSSQSASEAAPATDASPAAQ